MPNSAFASVLMTFCSLSIAQFLLLLLFLFAFYAFSPKKQQQLFPAENQAADECQPKDVEKGKEEGEVCYQSKEKLADGMKSYQFNGKKIAGEPDSKIYKASKFIRGIQLSESDEGKAFAVKVVSTGFFNRTIHLAKPTVMIKHEMKMLELMNQREDGKPVEERSVVKLYGGGEVEDGSAFAMIYIMEFGDKTLDKHLEQWDTNIKNIIKRKYEVEKKADEEKLAYEKEKQAYENEKQATEDEVRRETEELLPQLAGTLQIFHKEELKRISPKCDVWSFGVLTLEILAHTPQINPIEKREDPVELFVKLLGEFVNKIGMIKMVEEFLQFLHVRKKQENVKFDGKEFDIKKGVYMAQIEKHFPTEYGLLLKIFVNEPKNRIEMAGVMRMLKGKMAKYRQFFPKKGTKTEEKEEEKEAGKGVKEEVSEKRKSNRNSQR